jgi:hypothetical protein
MSHVLVPVTASMAADPALDAEQSLPVAARPCKNPISRSLRSAVYVLCRQYLGGPARNAA